MMYSYLLRKSKALTKWLWKHLYLSAKKEPAKVFTLLFLFQTRFLEVKLIIVLTKTLSSRSTQLQGLHHSALIFFWKYHRTPWREWLKREYMLSFFFFEKHVKNLGWQSSHVVLAFRIHIYYIRNTGRCHQDSQRCFSNMWY